MKKHVPTFHKWLMTILTGAWRITAIPMGFDLLQMLRELASMLRSGVPMDRALTLVAEGRNGRVQSRMKKVRDRVADGEPLSDALAALPDRWAPNVVRASVAAGERAGRLPELLDEIVHEYERLGLIDRRVRSIFIYPLFVLLFGLVTVHIVMWKVMPIFATLYSALGTDLPVLARFVRSAWIFVAPILWIVVPLTLVYLLSSISRRMRFSGASGPLTGLAWRMPVVRGLRRALIEVRFARSLRVLVNSGMPLPEALDLCEEIVGDDLAGQAIVESCRRIRDGETPSVALRGLRFLSPAFLWFLTDTETRGDFIEVTSAMADAAEDRFLTRIEMVERFLEPATTVLLGVVVGTVVIAVYQTMFRLPTLTGGGM
jgi:type II secretory pathway component PulF